MHVPRRVHALLLCALLVLPACASTIAGTAVTAAGPSTGSSTGGSTAGPAALEKYYQQKLSWEKCTNYAQTADDKRTYATPELLCAELTVPVSYDKPSTGDATVAVMKAPATGTRAGSVVFNPGGPGGSGLSMVSQFAAYGLGGDLRERYDLVGFDPRGTGASRPAITCRTDAERDEERAMNLRTTSAAQVKKMNDWSAQVAQWCVQRTGKDQGIDGASFLGSVGTRDVARDIDILRAALGDDKLTYVGYSYGTRLGTEYAEQFPDKVRAMILDGAVDPNQDSAAEVVEQGKGFQQAFVDFAGWCAKTKGGACPLGADPGKATAVYQHLTRPLLDKPAPVSDGRTLTFDDATTGTIQAMYSESFRDTLVTGLTELAKGNGDTLMSLADSYEDRGSNGKYSNLMDAFTAIRCMDDTRVAADKMVQLQKQYNAAAPFLDSGDPVVALKDVCDSWPATPTYAPHTPKVSGLATVMVISTTGDPATPYQAGVELSKDLGGALLTVKGTRHTAYLGAGIACADRIGTDYLVDLKIPADGASC